MGRRKRKSASPPKATMRTHSKMPPMTRLAQPTGEIDAMKLKVVDLTSAQLLALAATWPIVLPALPITKYYYVSEIVAQLKPGGTPYTASSPLLIGPGTPLGTTFYRFQDLSSLFNDDVAREYWKTEPQNQNNLNLVNGTAMAIVQAFGGSLTLGDGTLRLNIYYDVLDIKP